jgi:hypothetical protein
MQHNLWTSGSETVGLISQGLQGFAKGLKITASFLRIHITSQQILLLQSVFGFFIVIDFYFSEEQNINLFKMDFVLCVLVYSISKAYNYSY